MNVFSPMLAILFTLILAPVSVALAEPEPASVSAFYRLPLIQNPTLSPDGKHLAAIKNEAGVSSVMILDLATKEVVTAMEGDNREYVFNWLSWGNNERILLGVRFSEEVYGADKVFYKTKLVSMDINDRSKMTALVQPQKHGRVESFVQDEVVGLIENDPANILLPILDEEKTMMRSVYKVELSTGRRVMAKRADIDITQWFADANGNVRAGSGRDNSSKDYVVKVLDPQTDKWVVAWSSKSSIAPDLVPIGFGSNQNEFYVRTNYKGHQAIYKADLTKVGFPLTLVLSDEKNDLSGRLIYSKKYHEVVGLAYEIAGETRTYFWNEELRKLQGGLNKAFPNANASIVSVSDDLRKYIVFTQDVTTAGRYLYGDRDTKQLVPISDVYPDLPVNVLQKKELINFKSREGGELSGYLSLAKPKDKKNAPLVVLPPRASRVNANGQFDTLSAFLLNQGYSVFQPNVARSHLTKNGTFEFFSVGSQGLSLARDIEDAVRYLIEINAASSGQIAIAGMEYGGFAAVTGAVATPELFKCAISIGGLFDISSVFDTGVRWTGYEELKALMGTSSEQKLNAMLINNAEKIKVPVLLIHASKDVYMNVTQSREMAKALARANKDYQYLEVAGADREFSNLAQRKQVYEAVGAFLKKNLPTE